MSLAKQNLYAFIHLLQNQPSLFSAQDRANLNELCAPLSDDADILSDAIANWCQSHPEILQELRKTRRSLFPQGTGEKAPGSKDGKVPTPDYNANKQILENAIQQSSPPISFQSSKSGS